MYRLNSIIWISAGVIIGWFISQIVTKEHRRAELALPAEE